MTQNNTAHMSFYREPDFETLQIHAGQGVDAATNAKAIPIYETAGFVFNSVAHGAKLFEMRGGGYVYSRLSNPTVDAFEQRVAALEGGIAAVAASSGMAAQLMAISAICEAGDHLVISAYLYGGTTSQLNVTLKRFGISCTSVASVDPKDFESKITERTKAIYVETIPNPRFLVSPIEQLAEIANRHAIPLIVDNTLGMGGYLCRPISLGAHIVVQSATKWLGGQGTTIAGVIVDSGRFDWKASGKFPCLTEPSDSYQGAVYTDNFGPKAYTAKLRMEVMRDVGACLSAHAAFNLLKGIETLSLRAERHCFNALHLAKWLESSDKVKWVAYPGLPSHPSHECAKAMLRKGMFGGVLTFAPHGGAETANAVIENLKLATHLANLGESRTLVVRPSISSNLMQNSPDPNDSFSGSDLIRVSVGLESIDDIIADFENSLRTSVTVEWLTE
ncbi:Cys/Met metabolism PLP-dependent enzyme-domain-containing protein [Pterulicium gracile]|uniref:Cys/Met metabolism PLP-dependent enzyme-domain-containing protein n=1 Tax=Pterulicium gracile TaxID=1884261 RepID=A0A5C3QEV0_9AGAR|nr:Cys/Met metabolism PLP-dependent enzyme-domain-containing protein [Pterula gracilis]